MVESTLLTPAATKGRSRAGGAEGRGLLEHKAEEEEKRSHDCELESLGYLKQWKCTFVSDI